MTESAAEGTRDRVGVALVFLGLATTLAIIDATIVNVALPQISKDLGLSLSAGEWVVSGYSVAVAALLISAGRLADRFGQREVLILGVLLFATASLGCALAPNGTVLVLARIVQGAGAAAILPTVLGLINATYRGPAQGVAFAVYGATIGTAAALGPLVGSALITAFSWQAAFLINLPIAAIVVIGLLRTLPRRAGAPSEGNDPVGQLLLFAGLVLLVFGLVEAPRTGWFSTTSDLTLGPIHWSADRPVSLAFLALVASVTVLVDFLLLQRWRTRQGRPTLVDLSLFAIPSFRSGAMAVLVVALGEFGVLFLLPLYLQIGRDLTPLRAQLVVLPTALGAFISAPITARRPKVPARTWVLIGLGLEVVGLLLLAAGLGPDSPYLLLSAPLLVYGTGVGFAISQLSAATLLEVPLPRVGQAAGLSSTARQIGSAIGVAVLAAVVSGVLSLTLAARIDAQNTSLSEPARVAVAAAIAASPADPGAGGQALGTVPPSDRAGVQRATLESLSLGTRLAALAAVLPLAGAWLLARRLPVRRAA